MKLASFVTALGLVLGSSFASAKPAFEATETAAVDTRPSRIERFASDATFSINGVRKDVVVGRERGIFDSIAIGAVTGTTRITHVRVDFIDETYQITRDIDTTLVKGQRVMIDLEGDARAIKRIVAYGDTTGTFSVSGERVRAFASKTAFATDLKYSIKGVRQDIVVGADRGAFDAIEIRNRSGNTLVTHVRVDFTDGTYQITRDIDATLVGNAAIHLDLEGNHRQIKRVVAYGTTTGSFALTGMATR